MNQIKSIISEVREGVSHIIFPHVCLCCGEETLKEDRMVCFFCLNERFEDANPENEQSSSGVILPDNVIIQHALWKFDKGGILQDLMHHFKYERLVSVGSQLGRVLARRTLLHSQIVRRIEVSEAILVPVPLHSLKFKQRGFNQAYHIAHGINSTLSTPICSINAVIRTKFTRSQTGLTLQRRLKNVDNIFYVRQPKEFRNKLVIIVDDVFTTGATSFELAKVLTEAGADCIMVWTIAQA